MVSSADVYARKFSESSRTRSVTGVFVQMSGVLARVNVQGATVDVRCDGWYPPIPGMPVRVDVTNGQMRVVGPAQTLPPRAEVVEDVDSGTKASITDGVSGWVLPVMAPYVPIPGDVVVVNWVSGHVLGEEAAPPQQTNPGEIPPTSAPFTDLLIQAYQSGKFDLSYNNWWGGSEVWASNNNRGAWFYGNALTALAGAHIAKAEIYLPLISSVGSCAVGLHPHPTIPGGAPSIGSLVALDPRSGWVALPAGWGDLLRDNPSWGVGVVAPSGGLTKWWGVPGMSGALRFAGSR